MFTHLYSRGEVLHLARFAPVLATDGSTTRYTNAEHEKDTTNAFGCRGRRSLYTEPSVTNECVGATFDPAKLEALKRFQESSLRRHKAVRDDGMRIKL